MDAFSVTIVVPVHALDASTEVLLTKSLASIDAQVDYAPAAVILVGPAALSEHLSGLLRKSTDTHWSVVVNEGATDIASQLNATLAQVSTSYVTVLEFDDELGNQYLAEMAHHIAAHPEVEGWLPLVYGLSPNDQLLDYGNVALWVPRTAEERPDGFLDAETTETAPDLLLSGALLRTSLYTDGYGLKSSIQVAFVNEFYRRLIARGAVLRGMGKALYLHRERRPGSYVYELMVGPESLHSDQLTYWLDAARRESAFETERPVVSPA
jgi:hypothetical protein